jgi:hypothetical protein
VTNSKQHFEELISCEGLFVPMTFFAIWFEKYFCRIQEGHGSNVGKILNLLNATSMTLFKKFDLGKSLA